MIRRAHDHRRRRTCRICRAKVSPIMDTDLCEECALVEDTIESLCALRQRRWAELLACTRAHLERLAVQVSDRRVRLALGDVLAAGAVERTPGQYYLAPRPPALRETRRAA